MVTKSKPSKLGYLVLIVFCLQYGFSGDERVAREEARSCVRNRGRMIIYEGGVRIGHCIDVSIVLAM